MNKLSVALITVLILSFSVYGLVSADLTGGGEFNIFVNETTNIFETNQSVLFGQQLGGDQNILRMDSNNILQLTIDAITTGDSVWETSGGVVQLINPTSQMFIDSVFTNFTGNVQIQGNLSGGSPVTIIGGLNVVTGDTQTNTVKTLAVIDQSGGMIIGDIVYITGSSGERNTVALASSDDPDRIILWGLAAENGSNGDTINFVRIGRLSGLNTSGFISGTQLYLGINGSLNQEPPTEGIQFTAQVATAIVIDEVNGVIDVDIRMFYNRNDFNGVLRYALVNRNSGTQAIASITAQNNVNHIAAMGITSSEFVEEPTLFFNPTLENVTDISFFYSQGFNIMAFINDGPFDMNWDFALNGTQNGTLRQRMVLTPQGDLQIDRDLQVDGQGNFSKNITIADTIFGNEVYGSMAFFDPSNGNVTLTTVGVYENVNSLVPQFFNQVTSTNGTYLTALHDGIYDVSSSLTFLSQSGTYSFALGINDVEQNLTFQDQGVMATSISTESIEGQLNLSIGDNVSIMVADLDNPVKEVDVIRANLFMKRLGDN